MCWFEISVSRYVHSCYYCSLTGRREAKLAKAKLGEKLRKSEEMFVIIVQSKRYETDAC